jgi:acyl carrier protein
MTRSAEEVQDWIVAWISRRAGVPAASIDPQAPVTRYGVDSLGTVRLIADAELWLGVALRENPFAAYPTIEELARFLAEQTRS